MEGPIPEYLRGDLLHRPDLPGYRLLELWERIPKGAEHHDRINLCRGYASGWSPTGQAGDVHQYSSLVYRYRVDTSYILLD